MNYPHLRNVVALATIISSITVASFAFAAAPSQHQTVLSHGKHLNAFANKPETREGLGGIVTAINGTTITLSSSGKTPRTYTIDASKSRFTGQKINTITDIHVGDTLVALGSVTGDNVVAKTIFDRPVSEGVPKAFAKLHTAIPPVHHKN